MVVTEQFKTFADFVELAFLDNVFGLAPGLVESGDEHAQEDNDNAHNGKQFDDCEALFRSVWHRFTPSSQYIITNKFSHSFDSAQDGELVEPRVFYQVVAATISV
jgi:hypothetical protein